MKFLADMGVSMTTVHALREAGDDVSHLRDEHLQTLPDDQILEKARREQRTVLTFDLDFGELLAFAGDRSPSVVLFRMHNQTPVVVTERLFRVLAECRPALAAGAIVIVEDHRFRLRRLPLHGA